MTTILTLQLDATSQARFDRLRQLHFPPKRNHIPAHLTLFHTLPDTPAVVASLQAIGQRQLPFPIAVTGLRSLGKGVAYTLASPDLQRLHAALAKIFQDHLTPQDKQRFMPHIVVHNKATPESARQLLAGLERDFQPSEVQACGLDLWQYLAGPWRHLQTFPFASQDRCQAAQP